MQFCPSRECGSVFSGLSILAEPLNTTIRSILESVLVFLPSHLVGGYGIDLLVGDPRWWPHPIRWTGRLINSMEWVFYDKEASPLLQRLAGVGFWLAVMTMVLSGTILLIGITSQIHSLAGQLVMIWLAASCLATRCLHAEAAGVAHALAGDDIVTARESLGRIVSRDTSQLDEKEIIRALVETISENISDGIVAPIFFLALGGPLWAMAYKAVNTMDSMVGYLNDRYRYFGWFPARADDLVNWIPSRLSGVLLVGAARLLGLDWKQAWRIMARDAGKMKSPNAGYPEAAAAGALNVRLGGTNVYFGKPVDKPTLGDPTTPLGLEVYNKMVRLMYATSFLAFSLALVVRFVLVRL